MAAGRPPGLAMAASFLLCATATAAAAGFDLECLDSGQRSQFFTRQAEETAVAAIEVGPRLRLLRETRAAIDDTREAWAACEAGRPAGAPAQGCARERAAFDAANEALPAAEAIHSQAMTELRERTLQRVKAVREQFPACAGPK